MKRFIDAGVRLLPGVALVVALAIGGKLLSNWLQAVIAVAWIRSLASNVIIAIVGGMLIGNLVPLPKIFAPGIGTYEFFLKVGSAPGFSTASASSPLPGTSRLTRTSPSTIR